MKTRPRLGVGIVAAATAAAMAPGLSVGKGSEQAQAPRIIVLASYDVGAYQEVIAGFRRAVAGGITPSSIDLLPASDDATALGRVLDKARSSPAALIVTVGSVATRVAVHQVRETPVLASMILNAGEIEGVDNATAVVLEFPVEIELQWMQRLLPGRKRVAVLYNGEENTARIGEAVKAASALGLTLRVRKVGSALEVPDAVTELARISDIFWGLADPLVLNAHTARPILLVALRERTPFVGLSLNWVKAGALYALDRDYTDIGTQCGEMALQILSGTPVGALPPVPPRKVAYSINLKVGRALKIDLSDAVRRGAQVVVE